MKASSRPQRRRLPIAGIALVAAPALAAAQEGAASGGGQAALQEQGGEPVSLSPAEERELTEAMAAIRRGEYVDGSDLLGELRSPGA